MASPKKSDNTKSANKKGRVGYSKSVHTHRAG